MNLEQLEQAVIKWADERGIFRKATKGKQAEKSQEELDEMKLAIEELDVLKEIEFIHEINLEAEIRNAKVSIKDGIGDTVVTLILQAKMNDMTLQECLEFAYNEIKDRTGKMENGQFVKDK